MALIPASARKWHTLALWAAIGATMGFGAGGLFGIGPFGIVPFVLVMFYAVLVREHLDYDLTPTGAAVSAILFVAITLLIGQLT